MPTDAFCNFDMITQVSKLIQEAKNLGVKIEPKYLRVEFKSEKRYKDMIEETFVKVKENSKTHEEEGQQNIFEDIVGGQSSFDYTSSNSSSKKGPEILQIEDEYNSLMQNCIVLRRGRCGRYFAKYVQKSIFEDSDTSDMENGEDIGEKKALKKRRKRYQDLFEYLNFD